MFDASKTQSLTVTIGVQVNGKVRATLELSSSATEEEALSIARSNEVVAKWLSQGEVKRAVYVTGKIINFVVA
jgi:leucyl-tRNA synthetase